MSLIIYAIPVFFILIGIELLIAKMSKLSYYRFNDAITNLSLGVGSRMAGLFTKIFTFLGYLWLYEHSIWKIEVNALTVILLFIGVDFFYYWFHRLAHEISFLWGSHVVHHQSEEYNLTVALRQAWLQGVFSWVFYLPLAVLGFPPYLFLLIDSVQTLYQFWIHTRLINKMHPAFEYVFNTPSHHRVHHGVNPKYIDRNHGGTLIIFDRIFGTFQVEEEEVVYGITKQPKSWNPVWVNFEYWIDLFKETFSVKSHADKVRMMLKSPGWKPAELGGLETIKDVSYATFQKYDTDIPGPLNYYVLTQFVLVLAGATALLITEKSATFQSNMLLKAAVAGIVVLSLVNIGGIFERKNWVPILEYLRLAAIVAIVVLLARNSPYFYIIIGIISVLTVASGIWFSGFLQQFKTTNNSHAEVYAG